MNRDGVGGGRREDLQSGPEEGGRRRKKTEVFLFPTEHTLFSQSTSKYKVLLQSPFYNLYDIHLLPSNIITQDCLDAAKKTEKSRKKNERKIRFQKLSKEVMELKTITPSKTDVAE